MRAILVAVFLQAVHQEQLGLARRADGASARMATIRTVAVLMPEVLAGFPRWPEPLGWPW
jgi:hypothetical protein